MQLQMFQSREDILRKIDLKQLSVEEAARSLGITRQGLWKLRNNYRKYGSAALEGLKRGPKEYSSSWNNISKQTEEQIKKLYKEKNLGIVKLTSYLNQNGIDVSLSSVYRIINSVEEKNVIKNLQDKNISIVIPIDKNTFNITFFIEKIHKELSEENIRYEIFLVNNNITNSLINEIKKLEISYSVKLIEAHKETETLLSASYSTIVTIDRDLQYYPGTLTKMLAKLSQGYDIVIAKRLKELNPLFRYLVNPLFWKLFGKAMHGFDYEYQSGIKIFKKEIVERLQMNPSSKTFDIDFYVKTKDAGYKMAIEHVGLYKRHMIKNVKHVVSEYIATAISSTKLSFRGGEVIPFHPNTILQKGIGFNFKGKEFISHTDLSQAESAFYSLAPYQKLGGIFLILFAISSFLFSWHVTLVVIFALLNVMYFIDIIFYFFLIYRGFTRVGEIKITKKEIATIKETEWPTYTIFCPLYKEWSVVPQFVTAMQRLDYPKDKLQVLLLLEEDDIETIKKIKEFTLPSYFHILIVPDSMPKTKPKAMNYGLNHTTGDFIVVYDAEDVPDPLQLKKAVIAFKKAKPNTVCIQAKLNFYNPHQNLLTRLFTAEYSFWFELVLTGLHSIGAPIPLGGTSNHFRTVDIRKLKGWDAFNVTEDCDLGIRIFKQGYLTAVVDSTTLEEANSDFKNWFWQRTRWIKGYMQTYLVHMRHSKSYFKDWTNPKLATFQIVVGGKVLSTVINPMLWMVTISYFLFRPFVAGFIESLFPPPVFYMALFSLVLGNFLYLYAYMIGCVRRDYDDLVKYAFLVPVYWYTMSVASWVALYKLIREPFFWPKTKHGLHFDNKKAVAQATKMVGSDIIRS